MQLYKLVQLPPVVLPPVARLLLLQAARGADAAAPRVHAVVDHVAQRPRVVAKGLHAVRERRVAAGHLRGGGAGGGGAQGSAKAGAGVGGGGGGGREAPQEGGMRA